MPAPATPLPLPARARAVIVGIESYDLPGDSGANNTATVLDAAARIPPLAGVAADAIRLAASLQHDLGLAAGDIDLWLSPAPMPPPEAGWHCHSFSRDGFENFLTHVLAADAAGGLLLLFWSGHGVIDDKNRLRLLLPGSTIKKPRDFAAEDICNLLTGQDHARFSHQMLVFNACRVPVLSAGIEGRLSNTELPTTAPDAQQPVLQLRVFGCALGESSQQPADGALLLSALRKGWAGAGRTPWPDFEAIAVHAAQEVADQTDDEQRPQVIGWSGALRVAATPTLVALLGQLAWPTADFRDLALRCLRSNDRREAMPDVPAIVAALDNLTADAGVRPLHEFVARVLHKAGAAVPQGLHDWLGRRTNPQQRSDIEARLHNEPTLSVLQLWVQENPPEVQAALLDLDGHTLFPDWDIHAARAYDPGRAETLPQAMGYWLERALSCVQAPLLLELFVPTSCLAAGLDGCRLAADGDQYELGVELPTLLRALDRHKSRKKRDAWQLKARKILARYDTAIVLLHWSVEPADANVIRSQFAEDLATGAVWLGLSRPPGAASAVGGEPGAFDHGLDSGLPSMLWQRSGAPTLATALLEQTLQALLKGPASKLTLSLRAWRETHAAAMHGEPALLLDDPTRPPPWTQAFGRVAGTPTAQGV